MKRHWSYLKYIARHKWYVLVAGHKIGAGWFRLLTHDLSKFSPSEWKPYSETFYNKNGSNKKYKSNEGFDKAWLKHIHRNKHHWQYWVLRNDGGKVSTLIMPRKYVLEMVADWMGAGKAITGEWEYSDWYSKNKDKIVIHEATRALVEALIEERIC